MNKEKPKSGVLKHCYEMGYDSIKSGANTKNCDWLLFATVDRKDAWELGRANAKQEIKPQL